MRNKKTVNLKYSIFLMIFILIQPILDLSTSLSMYLLDTSLTPGIIIRMLIIFINSLFIIYACKYKENRKFLFFLIITAIFFIIHFIINMQLKPVFSLFAEASNIAKVVYLIVMLFAFIIAFKDLREHNLLNKYFPSNVFIASLIINVVMVLASITGTGILSYDALDKFGHSGWFFAANELSTLLAIILPIILWVTTRNREGYKALIFWLASILTIGSLTIIGTKAGYLAVVGSLVVLIVALILERYLHNNKRGTLLNLMIAVLILCIYIGSTKMLPVYINTNVQYEITREDQSLPDTNDTDDTPEEVDTPETTEPTVEDVVYSGRDRFNDMHSEYFKDAPLIQKIFGMGYAGNYEDNPIIIERDFHDLFYQFGYLGFALIFLPIIYYAIRTLITGLFSMSQLLSLKYLMLLSSTALGFGIAFIAGHTLVAPAVSTYLALVIGFIIVNLKIE